MPGLYYLILWKNYLEKENIWEPTLAVIHFRKLINTFHKKYLEKPTITSLPLDFVLPIVKLLIKLKQKRSRLSKGANK